MQYFKESDATEKKYVNAAGPVLDDLSAEKDAMHAGAYASAKLGEIIYDSKRSPLSNAIKREIFRIAFAEIFNAFVVAGSFESYITVFQRIFGTGVSITFTVPAAGKLTVAIIASEIEVSNAVMRYIDSNAYVFDNLVDYDGANLLFQTVKGFQSQYELEQMLFEIVPAGIFTSISLTIAGA